MARLAQVKVQRGDTISSVAKKGKTSVRAVLRGNPRLTTPKPGQVLRVPTNEGGAGGIGVPTAGPQGVGGVGAPYTSAGSRGRVNELPPAPYPKPTFLQSLVGYDPARPPLPGNYPGMEAAGRALRSLGYGVENVFQQFTGQVPVGGYKPNIVPPGYKSPKGVVPRTAPTPPGAPEKQVYPQRGPTDMSTYSTDRAADEKANLNAMVDMYRTLQPLIDAGLYQLSPAELRDMQRFGLITRGAAQTYLEGGAGTGGGGGWSGGGWGGGGGRGGGGGGATPVSRSYYRDLAYTGRIHWRI